MQITSFRVRGDDKVVLNGDDGKTYHVLHAENAMAWMAANTTNIPTLASISPVTLVANGAAPDATITLTGTNFAATDEVLVNNTPFTKTFVSATSMTILVKPSLVTPPAKWDISVRKGVFQTAPKGLSFTP
jgi:IPT/TIG domain